MPTDLVAVMMRKREVSRLERLNKMLLMGCGIVCFVVLTLISKSPTLASAVELLILE
jgi:hypothetical protein